MPKKTFGLYIKSHCEVPDYEDSVRAYSKRQAARKLIERLPVINRLEYGVEDILPYISKVKA